MNIRDRLPVAIEKRRSETGIGYRGLALALGLEASAAATLNRIVLGAPVSMDAQRDIARRMGLLRPRRRLHRVVMTTEEMAAWHALPKARRLPVLLAAGKDSQ